MSKILEEKLLVTIKGTPKSVESTKELLKKIVEFSVTVPGVKVVTIKTIDL